MVLAKKIVPNVLSDVANPESALASFNKDTLLAGTRQVSLNGALGQILHLASYANEVFSGITY